MTAGLVSPALGPISQGFDGANVNEFPGYLRSDAGGPLLARGGLIPNATYRPHLHKGVDIACPVGTPVHAPEAGIVVAVGTVARFADGSIDGEHYLFLRVYAGIATQTLLLFTHLDRATAQVGQRVRKGDPIAVSGASGRVTGPHLHWDVRTGPVADNPLLSWGRGWTYWNPERCMQGGDLARRVFLTPNA